MGNELREVRAGALGIAIVVLFALFVLTSGLVDPHQLLALFVRYLRASLALWCVAGLIGAVALLVRAWPRGGAPFPSPIGLLARWAVERWQRDRFLSLVWPPLLFASLMASFNAYKQMILVTSAFRLDPLFAAIDRALFFGNDPWTATHALFGSPWITMAIDKAYHGWFVPMALGVIVCAFLSGESYRLRTQYLLSYIAIWIGIGGVLAYLLPAAGPCFYYAFVGNGAADFHPLLERLAGDQAAIQAALPGARLDALANQAGLLASYGSDQLAVGGGISAMPSVHNALSALFALAAFRINRTAGRIMAGYALLIWVGSIHLGWHYAIDGIVSVALTIGIWKLTGRIADRLERPLLRSGPALAAA